MSIPALCLIFTIISWLAKIHPHYINNIEEEIRKKYFLRSCIFKTVYNLFHEKSGWLSMKSLDPNLFTSLFCSSVTLTYSPFFLHSLIFLPS